MSHFVPGRGWEPDPRGVDRNDPKAVADYERRYKEFYDKPIRDDGIEGPRKKVRKFNFPEKEVVTRPTRDLNDDRVWTGGSRDFDERTGTNRPGYRDRPNLIRDIRRSGEIPQDWDRKDPTQDISRERPKPKRDWWQEPRRDYRPEKSAKERRLELLTGGGGRRSSDSDRYSLLTGRGLSSNEDRMAMLTGRSDPPKEEWKSQYGGRREYDPQDREFNRQFNTEPTNNRDVRSWFPDSEPSRPISKPSNFPDDVGPGKKYPFGKPDPSHPPGVMYSKGPGATPDTNQNTTTGSETNAWGQKPLNSREIAEWNKKQEGFAKAQEDYETRLKALENRSPIVNQPTVDLSGIQGRLSELESKGPSWQEDRVKQLEGSSSESKSARNLLDQRIATLENYYKNDPPPEESTGNRYEDKLANLNKMWERTGKAQSWGEAAMAEPMKNKAHWDYSYSNDQGQEWAKDLPTGYIEGIRNLNREYNKPMHEAIIKGREYKAYDPRAAARLRYLDQENIHEDTYLGKGNWEDKYGELVYGKGEGDEARYFASQSGLEKDSDEYTERFTDRWGHMGKDYAWYK